MNPEIEHGLVHFRKSALPATAEKKVRLGLFGSFYWIVPASAMRIPEATPWDSEIRYAIKTWGRDLLDYEFARLNSPTSGTGVFDDLAQTLRLELLEHETRGDTVPRLTGKGSLHPNVVQVCKNRILDLWADLTVESPQKEKLPFAAIHHVRNPDWEPDAVDEDGNPIPEYVNRSGVESMDDAAPGAQDGAAAYDENAEGASLSQRVIEGDSDDDVNHIDDLATMRNAAEDRMIETLDAGTNEAWCQRAMAVLTDREQFAVRGWFGIDDIDLTKKQVAAELGIKQSSLKKLVRRATKKLLSEMSRQQDTEQRGYERPQPALPTNYWTEFHNAQLKVWADLRITKESYLQQLELRAKYPLRAPVEKLALTIESRETDGSWLEPRSIEFHDEYKLRWRTRGHFNIPAIVEDEDKSDSDRLNETIEQRESREAMIEAHGRAQHGGVTYVLESWWEKDVKLVGGRPTWRECSNPACPYDVLLVGHRVRITIKAPGAPCPSCELMNRQPTKRMLLAQHEAQKANLSPRAKELLVQGLAKYSSGRNIKSLYRVKCATCQTQDQINSLCDGCFADAFPIERKKRRGAVWFGEAVTL
jgi:DNA-directed RNA polymerase specialized sigma24 family protein